MFDFEEVISCFLLLFEVCSVDFLLGLELVGLLLGFEDVGLLFVCFLLFCFYDC